jgi:fucose permease
MSGSIQRAERPSGLSLLAVIWVALFAFGTLFGALGPSLGELAARTNSSLSEIGLITTLMFVGGLVVQSVAGAMLDRVGPLPLLLAGAAIIAVGTFAFSTGIWLPLVLALAFVTGIGHGLLDVSAQLVAVIAFPRNTLRALNSVHLAFGVGAMSGPAIASFSLTTWGTALPALWFGAGLFVALLPVLWHLNRTLRGIALPSAATPADGRRAAHHLYRSPVLWALGAIILLYVGVETGVGNWTSVYMQRSAEYTPADAALVASWYWTAFTLGRVFALFVGTRLKPASMIFLMLAGTSASATLYALGVGNAPLTIIATVLLGFFFGPVYPAVMALATSIFTGAQGKAASVIVAMGSVGGLTLPWLQGVILERLPINANSAFVIAGVAAMFAAMAAAQMFSRNIPALASAPERAAGD